MPTVQGRAQPHPAPIEIKITEMSSALSDLGGAVEQLKDRLGVLQARLDCVSLQKPKNPREAAPAYAGSPIGQIIRSEERKLRELYDFVDDMIDDLEV